MCNRSQEKVKISLIFNSLFKLAQGEYISPEKIEIILTKSELIEQVFIFGDSLQSSLVAIVVPNEEMLLKKGNKANFKEACESSECKQLIMDCFSLYGKKGTDELKGFEIPRNVYLETEHFSVDNNLLTDTFKLKRFEARKKYQGVIDTLYKEIQ